jgi:hypothetical protein
MADKKHEPSKANDKKGSGMGHNSGKKEKDKERHPENRSTNR